MESHPQHACAASLTDTRMAGEPSLLPVLPAQAPDIPQGPQETRLRHRNPNRGSAEVEGAQTDPAPEVGWTLTFDPVAAVEGDLAVDLRVVWLDNDEEPPRDRAVELPLGLRVLEGGQRVLVGTRQESRPEGEGQRETERVMA